MSDTVQRIKDKLSILDVISPYVKLVKAGKHYKGLSPFTKEKTPSFFVSIDRGLYHCFSTGKGGDMFTFVEEMEGVDFRGALKILAEKAGVPLPEYRSGERGVKERLYAALAAASDFFETTLAARADARAYLASRGVLPATAEAWSLGYAPSEWRSLHEELTKQGFTGLELERAGLVKKSEPHNTQREASDEDANPDASRSMLYAPRLYDRFRGRIMFPIKDVSGRIIAFSGRIFSAEGESASGGEDYQQAKYINSPETDVFDKSRVLYGIDRARESMRELGAAMLVEGQFDLVMAHQLGFKNAVATSGTAFTERHADVLGRYTPNLLIAYDGDRAGIAAAGRAAAVGLRARMNVKIAKLPPGVDPADLVQKDPTLLREAVRTALPVVDFYLAHLADAKYDARTFRLEVSRTVLPYVAMIPNSIDQAHFIQRVAEALAVPEEAVVAEVKKVPSSEFGVQSSHLELETKNSGLTGEPFLSRGDTIERLLYGLQCVLEERKDPEAKSIEAALRDALSPEEFAALPESAEKRVALFEADLFLERYADPAERSRVLADLFGTLKRESVHERYRETLSALRAAEAARDERKAEELMRELSALAPTLR